MSGPALTAARASSPCSGLPLYAREKGVSSAVRRLPAAGGLSGAARTSPASRPTSHPGCANHTTPVGRGYLTAGFGSARGCTSSGRPQAHYWCGREAPRSSAPGSVAARAAKGAVPGTDDRAIRRVADPTSRSLGEVAAHPDRSLVRMRWDRPRCATNSTWQASVSESFGSAPASCCAASGRARASRSPIGVDLLPCLHRSPKTRLHA